MGNTLRKKMLTECGHQQLQRFILTCALTLAGCLTGYGQDYLGLEDALRIGMENNFGIRITRHEMNIAANNNTIGNAGFLPVMTVSGGYEKSITSADVKVYSGTELDEKSAHTDWVDAGIYLNWTLFDGLNMFVNSDRLQTLQEMGEIEFRMSVEQVQAMIIIAYANIVRQQMMLAALNDQVELSRFRVEIAEVRKSVGASSELEYLQALVDLNADESALTDHQSTLANAKIILNELLARDIQRDFYVQDTIVLEEMLQQDSLFRESLANNSGVLMQQFEKELSELELKSMKGVRYPQVGFYSSYLFTENQTDASFISYNRQLGPHFGLTLDFTLFDGLNRSREVQNARIGTEMADLALMQYQQQLQSEVMRNYNRYESEIRVISLERQNLILAEKNMDIALESYKVGAISSIELREVQDNLLEARSRLISALFHVKARETELKRLSGRLAVGKWQLTVGNRQ